ncbi:hypothetical protein PAXRUDRAFT_830470 [Paxillus rubicundulus Ve08.2h10]|uniref:Uncharacterized protein n=1 Tax=Paxillus rubicundulus Ve08.2h10 TaxID=930991 RepID=A0A0D0E3Z6_9AGAM|nr:hypothetical protein PAXRUDRAFT_830470 [Paxillus rubicundulus Ve08.2h10]
MGHSITWAAPYATAPIPQPTHPKGHHSSSTLSPMGHPVINEPSSTGLPHIPWLPFLSPYTCVLVRCYVMIVDASLTSNTRPLITCCLPNQ